MWQVFALYRSVIRAARQHPASRDSIQAFARHSLEENRGVSKTNVMVVEHLMRKGVKQLAMLKSPDFAGFKWSKP